MLLLSQMLAQIVFTAGILASVLIVATGVIGAASRFSRDQSRHR